MGRPMNSHDIAPEIQRSKVDDIITRENNPTNITLHARLKRVSLSAGNRFGGIFEYGNTSLVFVGCTALFPRNILPLPMVAVSEELFTSIAMDLAAIISPNRRRTQSAFRFFIIEQLLLTGALRLIG